MSSVLDAAQLERRGIPTAAICTETFVHEAHNVAAIQGLEGFEPVVIPHPLSSLTDDQIEQRADIALEGCLRVLLEAGRA